MRRTGGRPAGALTSAVESLVAGNERFAAEAFRHGLGIAPTRRVMVVGCVDPRVDPAQVLGLEQGEAAVIRNVGGRVTPATLRTVAMLGVVTRARGGEAPGAGWDLVVLQHTDCGIGDLAAHPDLLAQYFEVDADDLGSLAVRDPHEAVRVDVARLQAAPLPAGLTVSGMVYDVATGRVTTVVEPTVLGA